MSAYSNSFDTHLSKCRYKTVFNHTNLAKSTQLRLDCLELYLALLRNRYLITSLWGTTWGEFMARAVGERKRNVFLVFNVSVEWETQTFLDFWQACHENVKSSISRLVRYSLVLSKLRSTWLHVSSARCDLESSDFILKNWHNWQNHNTTQNSQNRVWIQFTRKYQSWWFPVPIISS